MTRLSACTLLAVLAVPLAAGGCRIRSGQQPYWVETHGRGTFKRVAGVPLGVAALGTDGLLYSFPTPSGAFRPWPPDVRPVAVTGSRAGVLYVDQDGRLMQIAGDGPPVVRGQISGPVGTISALAVDAAGDVHLLRDGQAWKIAPGGDLVPGPCSTVKAVALAAVGSRLWLSDGRSLHLAEGSAADAPCAPASGPEQVLRLSGNAERLLALDRSGQAHLRGVDGRWQLLPRPRKYRPEQSPPPRPLADVGLGPTFAWAVDDEGAVFVLNDPRTPP